MKVKGYSGVTANRRNRSMDTLYYIEIWEQPLFRWLWSQVYHKWEKLTRRPMKHFSRWHAKHFEGGDEFFVPVDCRRDIKCYMYSTSKRDVLAILRVTEDDYDVITGKKCKLDEPRRTCEEPITLTEE